MDEQLKMLANCRYFASTDGSCAHNSVFLPEEANVILIPRAFYLTEYQLALNDMFDWNVTYIDASLSIFAPNSAPWSGPFFYYESEQLRRFFRITDSCNAKYWRIPLKDFKRHLKKEIYDKKIYLFEFRKQYMPEYYYRQLAYFMWKYQRSRPVYMMYYKMHVWGFWKTMRISVFSRIKALFKK